MFTLLANLHTNLPNVLLGDVEILSNVLGSTEVLGQQLTTLTFYDAFFAFVFVSTTGNFFLIMWSAISKTHMKPAISCVFGLLPFFVFVASYYILFT